MLDAADMFLPPYCSAIQRGRGTTFHVLRQSAATWVKFHAWASNMSFTPSLHSGCTISVQLCPTTTHKKIKIAQTQYERRDQSWPRSLGSQPAGDVSINPVVGCHYFPLSHVQPVTSSACQHGISFLQHFCTSTISKVNIFILTKCWRPILLS